MPKICRSGAWIWFLAGALSIVSAAATPGQVHGPVVQGRFIVTFGEALADVEVVIRSEGTGKETIATVAASGSMFFIAEVTQEDVLHFRSRDPQLIIEPASKSIALAPGVDAALTLTGLRFSRAATKPPPEQEKIVVVTPPPDRRPAPVGPCTRIDCLLQAASELERAINERDCSLSRAAVTQLNLEAERPVHFDAAPEVATELASFLLWCASRSDLQERDAHLTTLITLLEMSSRSWCERESARLLGRAYMGAARYQDALASIERAPCAGSVNSQEWGFYFSMRLDDTAKAAQYANRTEGNTRDLFTAWLGRLRGSCPASLERWPLIEPEPCHSLPRAVCLEEQALLLLACAGGDSARAAAATLKRLLPKDFDSSTLTSEAEQVVEVIAGLEYRGENWPEAAALLRRLATSELASKSERGRRHCWLGDILLRDGRDEASMAAFADAAVYLGEGDPDRLIALNNQLVVSEELGLVSAVNLEVLGRELSSIEATTVAKHIQDLLGVVRFNFAYLSAERALTGSHEAIEQLPKLAAEREHFRKAMEDLDGVRKQAISLRRDWCADLVLAGRKVANSDS